MDIEQKEGKDTREVVAEENEDGDIFAIEEVKVEEMAIDGICGVY